MDILTAFGLSASAGLNAYIPLLVIAFAARYTTLVTLAKPYDALTDPWVIGALVAMALVEGLADKVPAIDHLNDIVGTFVRPAAGAILFAAATSGAVTSIDPRLALLAGALTAGVAHGAKATARPLVTVSTAGVGNPVISTVEDVASLVTSVAAVLAPLLIGLAAAAFIALMLIWRMRHGPPCSSGEETE